MIEFVLQTVRLLDIAPSLVVKDTHAVGMFSDRGEVYNLQLAKKPGFSPKLTG
jgi:hypothetical protein